MGIFLSLNEERRHITKRSLFMNLVYPVQMALLTFCQKPNKRLKGRLLHQPKSSFEKFPQKVESVGMQQRWQSVTLCCCRIDVTGYCAQKVSPLQKGNGNFSFSYMFSPLNNSKVSVTLRYILFSAFFDVTIRRNWSLQIAYR